MPYADLEQRRAYSKAHNKKHYATNKSGIVARNKRNRLKVVEWFKEYNATLKCKVCSESEPCCLDFHHLGDKFNTLAVLSGTGYSIATLKKEIAKCIVLCANCHRKHHAGLIGI